MQARTAIQGRASSSKQIWFVVAALLAALVLGVAGAYLAKSLTVASAPTSVHIVQAGLQAPDAQDRNAQILRARSGPNLVDRNAQLPYAETHGH
jgi:hypothetical protein